MTDQDYAEQEFQVLLLGMKTEEKTTSQPLAFDGDLEKNSLAMKRIPLEARHGSPLYND